MKGLILKDLYMLKLYYKSYVIMIAVFLVASFFGKNMFFIYYPCLMCGMIPINLLAYDEQSRFIQYSATLPVSKVQIVSEKYIMGLFSQVAVLLITGIVQGIRMNINGNFSISEFVVLMLSLLIVSLLASSIPLPSVFKNGVAKSRIAYYVMIGFVCGSSILLSEYFKVNLPGKGLSGIIFSMLTILGVCVYVLSWYLSVVFFKRREF